MKAAKNPRFFYKGKAPVLKFVRSNGEPYVCFTKASRATRAKVKLLIRQARRREKNLEQVTYNKWRKRCGPFHRYAQRKYPNTQFQDRSRLYRKYRGYMLAEAPRKQAEGWCLVVAYCIALLSKDQGHVQAKMGPHQFSEGTSIHRLSSSRQGKRNS